MTACLLRLVLEEHGCRCRLVTAFRHVDHGSIDRVQVGDPVGTLSLEIVGLDDTSGGGIVSVYEPGRTVTSTMLTRRPRLSKLLKLKNSTKR